MLWIWTTLALAGDFGWKPGTTAEVTYEAVSHRPLNDQIAVDAKRTVTWTTTVEKRKGGGMILRRSGQKTVSSDTMPPIPGIEVQELLDDAPNYLSSLEIGATGELMTVTRDPAIDGVLEKAKGDVPPQQLQGAGAMMEASVLKNVGKEWWQALIRLWEQTGVVGGGEWSGDTTAPMPGTQVTVIIANTLKDAGEVPCSDAKGAPTCRKLVATGVPDEAAIEQIRLQGMSKLPPLHQTNEVWLEADSLRPWRMERTVSASEEGGESLSRTWTWSWK